MNEYAQSRIFGNGGISIEALVEGSGPLVVMIASMGRGAEDFADLTRRLVEAGRTVVRPQPRGIGRSRGPMEDVTLDSLADDVALVIDGLLAGSAVVIGHAFGQRVARVLATRRGDLVRGLVLLAAGGKVIASRQSLEALSSCFDLSLPTDRHIECVARAFFAPGNDPSAWKAGWFPTVARMQKGSVKGLDAGDRNEPSPNAARTLQDEAWHFGGGRPMLVVQGLQDAIASPENGRFLKAQFADRVELVELNQAGHALLPEQPDAVATAVIAFVRRLQGGCP
jgi:pimeloyl-ACP methyl ester carboxylesterase